MVAAELVCHPHDELLEVEIALIEVLALLEGADDQLIKLALPFLGYEWSTRNLFLI